LPHRKIVSAYDDTIAPIIKELIVRTQHRYAKINE
jgi:hypothetical protein